MTRKETLERHIRESSLLVGEYESKQQTSNDPKEKLSAGRSISEQRELLAGYLSEYASLCAALNSAMPADIAEIGASLGHSLGPSLDKQIHQGGSKVSDRVKILVIFANPKGSDHLRLDEEDRIIRECLERAKHRESMHYEIRHAVRVKDLQRMLLEDDYQVVHFSGHATSSGKLALEDEDGNPKLVAPGTLAALLSNFKSIECVLLNACYSAQAGGPVSLGIPFTIGMEGPISDDAAKHFTRGFYDALGAGKGYQFAYNMGCSAMALEGFAAEELTPQFMEKQST